jgi:AraC family transcriptional regulator
MHHDIPCHKPANLSRSESGPPLDKDSHPLSCPDADVNYWMQPAGTWRERNVPASLVLVLLGSAPALLNSRGPDGRPDRTAVSGEAAWFLPAGMPFSAHWHGPLAIACLGLVPPVAGYVRSRIFRLIDLARLDWELAEQLRGFPRTGDGGREEAMAVAQRVAAVLQKQETLWRNIGLSTERLQATTDFIEEHLAQKLSRELLARADGQSLHHFARMFKLRTGLSLREYIALRRCFRARELIAAGVRLVDASATVGFFDQPEMSRKFNQIFGCPPGTFAPADPD